eukprot:10763742-Ditylum_brightwellii.AAC.1
MARPNTKMLAASDRSASKQENTMSFGWVVSPLNSMILATHSGPVFGHASLFCAEGYSLLLVTCFLYHLQRYTQLTLPCNISIYIDNKGAVTRATSQIEYEYGYPYNTLEHDWDVIAQSAEYLQTLGSKLKVAHVKSHQDDNCDFDQLDLLAQLNAQAVKLATAYRVNASQPQVAIQQSPINDTQLIHDSGTITGHYCKKIHNIATEKDLAQHIMETNSWTIEDFLWID